MPNYIERHQGLPRSLLNRKDRQPGRVLSRRRSEGRSGPSPPAWISHFLEHVSQPHSQARRGVSRHCARLPRLWIDDHAGSQRVLVHLREPHEHSGRSRQPSRPQEVFDIRHGLRCSCRISAGSARTPNAFRRSSFRTATHTTKVFCSSGIPSRNTGTNRPLRIVKPFDSW